MNKGNLFAKKLRDYRARTGMTQRKAAADHGVPLPTWRQWEQGVHAPVLDDRITALLDAMGGAQAVSLPPELVAKIKILKGALEAVIPSPPVEAVEAVEAVPTAQQER